MSISWISQPQYRLEAFGGLMEPAEYSFVVKSCRLTALSLSLFPVPSPFRPFFSARGGYGGDDRGLDTRRRKGGRDPPSFVAIVKRGQTIKLFTTFRTSNITILCGVPHVL